MKTAPCNGCDRRLIGCHGLCPDYREWKDDREKQKEAKRTETPELSRNMKKHIWKKMLGK